MNRGRKPNDLKKCEVEVEDNIADPRDLPLSLDTGERAEAGERSDTFPEQVEGRRHAGALSAGSRVPPMRTARPGYGRGPGTRTGCALGIFCLELNYLFLRSDDEHRDGGFKPFGNDSLGDPRLSFKELVPKREGIGKIWRCQAAKEIDIYKYWWGLGW